jgi:hypothetical protein
MGESDVVGLGGTDECGSAESSSLPATVAGDASTVIGVGDDVDEGVGLGDEADVFWGGYGIAEDV